ncbi:MAG: DUF1805 domain-containing protein [Erysipelotrichaceae bacterium]|nr:DUF1805 domain-containing protein [Erysipelotrichaceae bacterium]
MIIKDGILKDDEISLETLEVNLGNTTLLLLEGYNAFAMCGALDVDIYNTPRMLERKVACFKAVGVKTLEQLYEAEIYEASEYAKSLGINKGIRVSEAFKKLSQK